LKMKGTDLHAATVVGDTVGDPFKDTSSVALNPVIKFTTLFGLLAVEIAVTIPHQSVKTLIGGFFLIVALVFIYRSFYAMRIPDEDLEADDNLIHPSPTEKTAEPVTTQTGTASFVTGSGVRAK